MTLIWDPDARTAEITPRTAAVAAFVLGLACGFLIDYPPDVTIGGSPVPAGLSCAEDEVVGLTPDGPTCVHIEEVWGR